MLTEKQEEKAREIAKGITERATNDEFGWRYGINGNISWEELQKLRENISPTLIRTHKCKNYVEGDEYCRCCPQTDYYSCFIRRK